LHCGLAQVSWLNNDIQAILGALRPSFHHKEN
jgi:hypothetical protein